MGEGCCYSESCWQLGLEPQKKQGRKQKSLMAVQAARVGCSAMGARLPGLMVAMEDGSCQLDQIQTAVELDGAKAGEIASAQGCPGLL